MSKKSKQRKSHKLTSEETKPIVNKKDMVEDEGIVSGIMDTVGGVVNNMIPAILKVEEDLNAVEMLEADHDKVDSLFKQYESTEDKKIAEQIFMELEVHTKLEEEIFYPAIKEINEELVAESIEEHNVIKTLIKDLKHKDIDEEQYKAKMKVLQENVDHHVEEEEDEMFPQVESELGDKLMNLGDKMRVRKRELQKKAAHKA
jgi:hemerythrin superfamily protein